MLGRSIFISFLGILFFFALLPAQLTGQEAGLYIQEQFVDVDLQQALRQLENNYQLKIAYEHEAVRNKAITARIQTGSLDEAFRQLLRNTGLEFRLVGPRRILIRASATTSLSGNEAEAPKPPRSVRLTGVIRDGLNAAPLPYANVYCSNGQGASTDENGAFQLDLDLADFPLSLQVSYVGYYDRRVGIDSSGRSLRIELTPRVQELSGVEVFEEKPTVAQVLRQHATEVSIPQLSDLPAFVGGHDVLRDLQLLPGISAYDDLSANFSVRGGHESENMILLDGITLFNVDHYFGIFSVINPSIVDKVTVYKNAFPAQYGGRTASVIDIRSKSPVLSEVEGEMEFNLLTTSASLKIPLGKRAGLLLGGRATNTDLANGSLFDVLEQDSRVQEPRENPLREATNNQLTTIEPDFRFHDLNAKLFWQIGARTAATASFFQGYDEFSYRLDDNIRISLPRRKIESDTRYLEEAGWRNRGLSLALEQMWTPNLSSHLILSHSTYESDNLLDYNLDYTAPNRSDSIRIDNRIENAIRSWDLNFKNTWDIQYNQRLDVGLQLTRNEVDFRFQLNDRNILNGYQLAWQNALYAQYQIRSRDDRFQLQAGLRQNFYSRTGAGYLSPRISTSYQLSDQWLLKGAWSKYHQFLRESTHENALGRASNFWVLAGERRFPVSNSVNRMLGLRFTPAVFDLDIEFYDRKIAGVVEHAQAFTGLSAADGKPLRRNFVFFVGDGRTRGMDVLLRKTSGPYTGWISYTLSKSTNSFPQIDRGAPFPAQNDRRHQLQFVQQYQWKKWNFSLTYVFTSGRPYTDLSLLSKDADDRQNLTAADRISYLEDYHRVDLGANYQFPLWKGQAELGASIFNLFDRENVKYRQYIYNLRDANPVTQRSINTVLGTELQMLRFTPNLRFAWAF